jgi:hypothetical protein
MVHARLFCRHAECKSYRVMEASDEIFEESVGIQVVCITIKVLQEATDSTMCGVVRVKLRL